MRQAAAAVGTPKEREEPLGWQKVPDLQAFGVWEVLSRASIRDERFARVSRIRLTCGFVDSLFFPASSATTQPVNLMLFAIQSALGVPLSL